VSNLDRLAVHTSSVSLSPQQREAMWKRKKPKNIVSSRMSKCSFCDKEFDWMTTPAIVNGAKKEFCGYECFSKNFENAVRHDYGTDFDSL
jgi:hypothetical protein